MEKKRTERMKKAGKIQERPDTYESLVRNQHHVSLVIIHATVCVVPGIDVICIIS